MWINVQHAEINHWAERHTCHSDQPGGVGGWEGDLICKFLLDTFATPDSCTMATRANPWPFYPAFVISPDRTAARVGRLPQNGFLSFFLDPPLSHFRLRLTEAVSICEEEHQTEPFKIEKNPKQNRCSRYSSVMVGMRSQSLAPPTARLSPAHSQA